jgi:hypothetical protein
MNLGVMPFAQQRRILQRRLTLVEDPLEEVVNVELARVPQPALCTFNDAAVPVAVLDRPAQVRRDQSLAAPVVQRPAVGIEHEAGDGPVAGGPPGPGRGQQRPEPGGGRPRTGRGVDQVLDADGDHDLGFHRAQDRQVSRREGGVGQLHVLPGRDGLGQHRVPLGKVHALLEGGVRFASTATGATTATCSAVTTPSENPAATAGSCSSAPPLRNSCPAAPHDAVTPVAD